MKKIALLFSSDTYANKLQQLLKQKTDNDIDIIDIGKVEQLSDDAVLVLDAHLGKIKSDYLGLELHNEIRKNGKGLKVIAYSWLNKKQLVSAGAYFNQDNNNLFWQEDYHQSVLFQFPISVNTLLQELKI